MAGEDLWGVARITPAPDAPAPDMSPIGDPRLAVRHELDRTMSAWRAVPLLAAIYLSTPTGPNPLRDKALNAKTTGRWPVSANGRPLAVDCARGQLIHREEFDVASAATDGDHRDALAAPGLLDGYRWCQQLIDGTDVDAIDHGETLFALEAHPSLMPIAGWRGLEQADPNRVWAATVAALAPEWFGTLFELFAAAEHLAVSAGSGARSIVEAHPPAHTIPTPSPTANPTPAPGAQP